MMTHVLRGQLKGHVGIFIFNHLSDLSIVFNHHFFQTFVFSIVRGKMSKVPLNLRNQNPIPLLLERKSKERRVFEDFWQPSNRRRGFQGATKV